MRSRLCLLLVLLPLSAAAQEIPHTAFTLDNGMQVVFHEDHDLPLVTVNTIYRYGSLDEPDGQTGYAHLAEHLMFMGTTRVPGGSFDQIMENGGGWNNASTGDDYTVYYDVGPASMLPTLLWLEADRMERLGPDMDRQKLDLQRDVVRNERRQNYEVAPYGVAWLSMPGTMYPDGHPYAHPGIGSHADLISATVEDFQTIYATGYAPANASMVIAGDFDPQTTREMVENLFGDLPGGAPLERPEPHAMSLEREKRLVLEDQIEIPRLVMAWHSPLWLAEGDAALDLLGSILGDDKVGRLNQSLVLEQEIAQWVGAFQSSALLGSTFMVMADAREGIGIDQLEQAVDTELRRILDEGPVDQELQRAKNQWEASFVSRLESLDSRASLLNRYWLYTGDHGYVARDLQRYRGATIDDIRNAAEQVLVPDRLVMWIVPEGEAEHWLATLPNAETWTETDEIPPPPISDATSEIEPEIEPEIESEIEPEIESQLESQLESPKNPRDVRPDDLPWTDFVPAEPDTFELANGLEVWHLQRSTVPVLTVSLVLPFGSAHDPADKAGLAELMADLMDEGAGSRDATELAEALATQGAHVSTGATTESLVVRSWMLTRTAKDVLPIVSDVVLHPKLAKGDFERVKWQTQSYITQRAQDPRSVASLVAWRRFFGDDHPYSWPTAGYRDTVAAISPRDVKKSYRQLVVPEGAVLIVVGDAGEAAVKELLEESFGQWKPRTAPRAQQPLPAPEHTEVAGQRVLIVDRPGSPQTAIRLQMPGTFAAAPDRIERHLVNSTLGGSFTSRLMQNLREEKGWTYGVGSYPVRFRRDGAIVVTTSLETQYTGAALAEIIEEIEILAEGGLTAEEATKAIRSYQQEQVESYGSIPSLNAELVSLARRQLPADSSAQALLSASAATAETLSTTAADMYYPSEMTVVLVGDGEVIRGQLEQKELPSAIPCDTDGRLLDSP